MSRKLIEKKLGRSNRIPFLLNNGFGHFYEGRSIKSLENPKDGDHGIRKVWFLGKWIRIIWKTKYEIKKMKHPPYSHKLVSSNFFFNSKLATVSDEREMRL